MIQAARGELTQRLIRLKHRVVLIRGIGQLEIRLLRNNPGCLLVRAEVNRFAQGCQTKVENK